MGGAQMKSVPLTHDEIMTHAFFEQDNGQVFLVPLTGLPTLQSDLTRFMFDLRGMDNSVKTLVLASFSMYHVLHHIRNELLTAENAAADILPPGFEVDQRGLQLVDLTMALAREGLNATVTKANFEKNMKKT